jgi:hypothetical protein
METTVKPLAIRSMPVVLLSAALLALPSCSEKPPAPMTERSESQNIEPGVPGGIAVRTTTLTANVVSVDKKTRELTLDGPEGKRFTVKCGPEVVNFDQIRAGDQVKVNSTEEVAVSMAAESEDPGAGAVTAVALAPKGASPRAVMASTKQVTCTVTAIDVAAHTATLQFPGGQTRTISVRPDVDLSKRKVGEKVVIRTTDSMALSVEKPQPTK